ncbi:MAG: hypothetical protein JWM14_2819 [Chitinophagaceae bacterium]|nr:hypothetical protein [Chitinophagaceae bacterium]
MFAWIYKIVFFFWNTFAPERAKEAMQKVIKDFMHMVLLLVFLSFVFGAGFFVGTYFLGLWLSSHIEQTFICYLIACTVAFFFTLVLAVVVFRSIISGFFERLHEEGNDIVEAFTPHKKL